MKKHFDLLASAARMATMAAVGVIMILMISQVYQTRDQVRALKTIQENQAKAVDQLKASVKTLSDVSDQNAKLIICMLQVPVAQRTTDTEAMCRRKTTIDAISTDTAVPAPAAGTGPVSTPQTTAPAPSPTPPPTPTPKTITRSITDVLGKVFTGQQCITKRLCI